MTSPALDLNAWREASPDQSLVIADGQNVRVGVKDKCLVIWDGPDGQADRVYSQPKKTRTIKHLMILGAHGYVSLEAAAWMYDNGVSWAIVGWPTRATGDLEDSMPRILGMSGRAYADPMLQRKLAMCYKGLPLEHVGLELVTGFMTDKLEGQARIAETRLGDPDCACYIRQRLAEIQAAPDVTKMRTIEANAAGAYWKCWQRNVVPQWNYPKPLNSAWRAYPGRASKNYASESNRNASDPVNALLNWGYKILETVVSLNLMAACLPLTMGISHVDLADGRERNGFVLDVMEGARPLVDEIVLDVISDPMDKRLFPEGVRGYVTVDAPMTHDVASRIRKVAYTIDSTAFTIAKTLTDAKWQA